MWQDDGVSAPTPNRGARRRERTRARLIEAGRGLLSQRSADALTISGVTEAADVALGSFYNHFSTKEELVEAVVTEATEHEGATVEALTRDVDDPAEVVSIAHRHFVTLARNDPDWAWLLVRLDASHRVMAEALGPHAWRDLRAGLESGRFDVPDEMVALVSSGGALLNVMRGVLEGGLGDDADVVHAEGMLRLFGVPAKEAAKVARRPLPEAAPASDSG
jgi:AcrR family transcriptional regulator